MKDVDRIPNFHFPIVGRWRLECVRVLVKKSDYRSTNKDEGNETNLSRNEPMRKRHSPDQLLCLGPLFDLLTRIEEKKKEQEQKFQKKSK